MRLLRYSWESLLRNRKKTALNLAVCLMTVILLNVFAGNIAGVYRQLDELPKVVKVDAVISNLCGSMDAGLDIRRQDMDAILANEFVENPAFTTQIKFGLGEFSEEEYLNHLKYYACASTSIGGIPGLLEEDVSMSDGITTDAFFSSTEPICLVDVVFLQNNGLSIGDRVTLTCYYYRYELEHMIYLDPLTVQSFTIAGTMDIGEYHGDGMQPDIIFPLYAIRDIFDAKGIEFSADSGSFRINDPYRLNEFKEQMHDIGFLPVIFKAEMQYDGNALTVKDETFISSARQLFKNRDLLLWILPFLVFAVLCVGFVTAQLLMKGRRAEYAIMRSLGQTHRQGMTALCAEYGTIAFVGCAIGTVIGVTVLKTDPLTAVLAAAAFLLFYIIGTTAALSSLKKMSIISVLGKND